MSAADTAGVLSAMDRLLDLGGATPARRMVEAAGLRLHVLEQGGGAPLLLLHGGSGGGANWYRLFGPLARTHRVIAPDLPGFGLSPAVAPEPPLGRQAARLLVRLLDALELPRVSVLGTSFGGLAALRLAQHFPARVDRLLLLDSAGLGRTLPLRVRLALLPLVHRYALRPSERGTRWLLRSLLTSRRLPPAHEEALVAWLHGVARANPTSAAAALRSFADSRGQRERCRPAELAAVRAPTLLLWGSRDRFFPVADARRSASRFPHGELVLFEQAGHSPNWEVPEQLIEQVRRFLAADTL